jgi:putative flippase GtrA
VSHKFIVQAGGIAAGMVVNFILSKLLVFRKKEAKNDLET